MRSRHERVSEGFSTDAWVDAVDVSALSSEKWLLAYELGIREEKVGKGTAGKGWSSDRIGALFHKLKKADVAFTVDKFGYSEQEFDSDEYDYSLDEDSDKDDDFDDDDVSDLL